MKVATHDERFHTDEVFAVAILRLIFPKIKVIRTKNPEIYSKADIVVDMGREYNVQEGLFDHHQKGIKERENGTPYSSAGLVWKHFGMKLVKSQEVFGIIDKKIFQPIDMNDNGVEFYKVNKNIFPYTISNVINSFLPTNKKNNSREFFKAVKFAKGLLKREVEYSKNIIRDKQIVRRIISETKERRYIILPRKYSWESAVMEEPSIKFVIYPHSGGKWTARAVPSGEGLFRYKKLFPRKWAGMGERNLQEITEVGGAMFCHKSLFAVFAETKEDAMKLVEIALKSK